MVLSSYMGLDVHTWMSHILECLRDSPTGTPKVLELDIADFPLIGADLFLAWIQEKVSSVRCGV